MKILYKLLCLLFPIPLYCYIMGTTPLVDGLMNVYLYGMIVSQSVSVACIMAIVYFMPRIIVNEGAMEQIREINTDLWSMKYFAFTAITTVNSAIFFLMGNAMGVVLFALMVLIYLYGAMLTGKLRQVG